MSATIEGVSYKRTVQIKPRDDHGVMRWRMKPQDADGPDLLRKDYGQDLVLLTIKKRGRATVEAKKKKRKGKERKSR